MKLTKPPAKEKPVRVNRISCYETNYSPAALLMMEKATGQRIVQLPAPTPPLQETPAE